MPRQPEPWYWKARKAWYVQLNGKHIRLHENKKEAEREWHRIMASEGLLDRRQSEQMTVADACEAYISQSQHLRANTLRQCTHKLSLFADSQFGNKRLADVAPDEVIRWVRSIKWAGSGTGEGSRHLLFRYIKTVYKWARDSGVSQQNTFARMPNPWKVLPRSRPMTENEYRLIMGRPLLSVQFKEVVEFVWRTGIRPGELSILAARHLDARMRIARFQPTEHKTGTKTGLQREVYFPADLWDRLIGYKALRPTGPLLRKANGKAWTAKKISDHFLSLKKNTGLTCVLYQARHRYATDMLQNGVPPERVAKMLGQVRPDVLLSTYYHPAAEQMSSDASILDAGHEKSMDQVAADVAALKAEQLRKKRERERKGQAARRARLKDAERDT